ncbi:major facilitator superfamily transporter [Lecanosticta acicola]|uniref:Major facilitator superfamily transporter n=1 Tax=Lecanosticta acicola TaxID=111012 RepID=A0AAI8Z1M8_9PEZI|nr:major facilitator superfamily transporter [Lecanosticta acicola]
MSPEKWEAPQPEHPSISSDEEARPKEEIETPLRGPSPEPELNDVDREAPQGALAKTVSLEKQVSLSREILVVGLIVLAQFTTQVGLGQLLSIIHVIGDSFGITDPGVLSWLIAGYSLTVGTFILFTGRLGDIFGWKKMLIIGYVWFAVWSLVAGLSVYSNHVLFIFARVLQGIGPAICLPNALALLGGLYSTGKRKNMAFAVFGACAPGGSIVGAAMAGVFALAWWPWTFWSISITLFIIAIVAAWAIPDPQDHKPGIKGAGMMGGIAELDFFGAIIGVLALVLFNFSWNQAPIVGWQEPYIIVTLILGVLLVPVFFYYEIKIAEHPLLPFDVFTSSNGFVLACVACGWANFGIWVYYFWQILLVLRGASPLLASAYLSPIPVSGGIAAIVTGLVLHKLRPAWVMVIALCCFLTGVILVATLDPLQIYWGQIFVTCLVAPFGMDMSFPSATIVVSDSVKKEHQGVAASLVNTIVNYSISLGLGFAGTVEVHVNNGGATWEDTLKGYRGALYMGIGLAGLGVFIAICFVSNSYWDDRKASKRQAQEQNGEPERKA